MDAAKVEIAFVGHVRNVGRDSLLLAQFPDSRRGCRVVDGDQHHVCLVQIGWLKQPVDMCNLLLRDSVCDLFIQPGRRADDSDFGIGVETVENAARRNLSIDSLVSPAAFLPIAKSPESPCSLQTSEFRNAIRPTSPPPTTRTCLSLMRHARIKLPPGCTCGNDLLIVEFRIKVAFDMWFEAIGLVISKFDSNILLSQGSSYAWFAFLSGGIGDFSEF